ncbi:MAG: HmuY family protein [Ginsengibacter sp.]
MKTLKLTVLASAAVLTGLISCGKKDNPTPATSPSVTVTDSIEIPFSSSNYTLYSFKDSSIIPNSDSATTKWDFGIRFVSIITNSHASGPGNAGVITQQGIFDNLTQAPESGYSYDTASTKLGIDASQTTGWYNYDESTHAFSPKAGQFFIFRTSDNHYAKMEILAVTYSGYNGPTSPPTTLIYKFRYTYQADGSRNF